jgi:hypothetical protein
MPDCVETFNAYQTCELAAGGASGLRDGPMGPINALAKQP